MPILYYLIVIIILLFIFIFVIFYLSGFLNKYESPSPNIDEMKNSYNIKSPWGQTVPVDGTYGTCSTYTFVSNNILIPPTFNMNDIETCEIDNTCFRSETSACIDTDQISAKKVKHMCTGKELVDISSGYCLKQNGDLAVIGEEEEFFTVCEPTKLCPGFLSLIAFNMKQEIGFGMFSGAVCFKSPEYIRKSEREYNFLTPVKQQFCNLIETYQGFPSQIFRIERANYENGKFISNQFGDFYRITHRPSGYFLSPELRGKNTFPLADLKFVKINRISDGYVWSYIDEIVDLKNPTLFGIPQFIYIDNPERFSLKLSIYTYLTDSENPVYGIQPETVLKDGKIEIVNLGNIKMGTYFFYSKNSNLFQLYKTTYLKYSILPFLLQNG